MKSFLQTAAGNAWQFLRSNAFAFLFLFGLLLGMDVSAQTVTTLPDISATMDTAKTLAYTAIGIAVAIVGVKMGIKFVKWIRG